ncbi:MAG: ATP-binding protein [Proteobacteria bacterium]|nr:ATP-binding protein [Pseudomonadota bacterium]
MTNKFGKISAELIYGIFLLTLLSIIITFIATIKIVEKQRIEIEVFNLQKIFYDLEKNPIDNNLKLYLPGGIAYGIYDIEKKTNISGIDSLSKDDIKWREGMDIEVEKDFLYPSITAKKVIYLTGRPYLIFLKRDFDAEKNSLRSIIILFIPFGLISLVTLTLFTFAYYRKRFLVPFENLKKAYKSVSEDNITVRIDKSNVKEWDLIYDQFNEMMEKIESYKNKLEHNIEELKKINLALKSAQEEIIFSEKMATVGRLSAGLAHEIGNPLTSIMGYISYLKENAKSDEEREILDLIFRETERINRIIRDLLNFARSKNEGGVSVCNVRDVIEDIIRLLAPQKDFKNIELINNVSEGKAVIFSTEELKQVLLNIIINAVDASRDGGKIQIDYQIEEDNFIISVTDEGGGIPDEIADKIFDPFFTTKPVGKGTGLGLSVAHSLVTKYGGKIYFKNYDRGCIFFVRLKIFGG